MSIEWTELAEFDATRLERMSRAEQFRFWLLRLVGIPYVWGEETPVGTDSSGTIAFALWMMGYDLRLTADGFMRRVFTIEWDSDVDIDRGTAMFYRLRCGQSRGGRTVGIGAAVHVTPVVGPRVVLNARDVRNTEIEPSTEAAMRYEGEGCWADLRAIDWAEAGRLSRDGGNAWDVNPLLGILRG